MAQLTIDELKQARKDIYERGGVKRVRVGDTDEMTMQGPEDIEYNRLGLLYRDAVNYERARYGY